MATQSQRNIPPLSKQAHSLVVGGTYTHYKGEHYTVLGVGLHTETLEEMVIYRAEYGDRVVWVRPLTMFMEHITLEGVVIPRFQHIDCASG